MSRRSLSLSTLSVIVAGLGASPSPTRRLPAP